MILTVTINPLIEHRLTFNKILPGIQNRNGKLCLAAGGKGINVSRQLNKLDVQNVALTFAGGTFGKLFRNTIKREGIDFSIINTHSETRMCTVTIDTSLNKVDYYFSENQEITKDEADTFISKLDKMIQNCEIVIFSGSSPCPEADIIFPEGIRLANKYGKVSFCDTYGRHLKDCFNASPTVVHNNIDELESGFKIDLKIEKNILSLLTQLYRKNIKQVFVTNEGEKSYASNFDFHYTVSVPDIYPVDSTGSGDSFVAGIAFGWHKNFIFDERVKLATALGTINAGRFGVSNVEYNDAAELVNDVKIIPLGKKMKLIDDTPD